MVMKKKSIARDLEPISVGQPETCGVRCNAEFFRAHPSSGMRMLLLVSHVVAALACATSVHAATLELQGIGGTYAVPVTSIKEARFRGTLRQKYDFSCGSAAIATLLTHQYGFPANEQTVFEGMYASGDRDKIRREGFSLLDMKRYLKSVGYEADGFVQPLDKLLDAGLPAIVLIAEKGYHHFVVLKGIRDGRVLIGDPATGTRAMTRSAFEAIWVNRLLFVIHNHQQSAVFNDATDWRAAPFAPLSSATRHEIGVGITLPKLGPGDF
jgi:predicted double-glycine peptidase